MMLIKRCLKKGGHPRFKSKYKRNSYNTTAIYSNYKDKKYCNIELDRDLNASINITFEGLKLYMKNSIRI